MRRFLALFLSMMLLVSTPIEMFASHVNGVSVSTDGVQSEETKEIYDVEVDVKNADIIYKNTVDGVKCVVYSDGYMTFSGTATSTRPVFHPSKLLRVRVSSSANYLKKIFFLII